MHSLSFNPVEGFRTGMALRTSNGFSRRIELGGKLYYGFGDERFNMEVHSGQYHAQKTGMLTTYYNYDIEQIGISRNGSSVGSTFSSILRTGPLDKLTFVSRDRGEPGKRPRARISFCLAGLNGRNIRHLD